MYKDTIKQGMEYQVYSGFVPVVDVYLAKKMKIGISLSFVVQLFEA
jgi:hypothetical protein